MHAYVHTYKMHTYIQTYIHACIHTYTHSYIDRYMHTYIDTYVHRYIHAYIHTYIYGNFQLIALLLLVQNMAAPRGNKIALFRFASEVLLLSQNRIEANSVLLALQEEVVFVEFAPKTFVTSPGNQFSSKLLLNSSKGPECQN